MLVKSQRILAHGSSRWVEQQAHDPFIAATRQKGYVARSAFKLLYIDDKYKLFHRNQTRTVIDLGCSPGGWCQIIREKCGDTCRILAIDLLDLRATMTNATFIKGDFTSNELQQTLLGHLRNSSYRQHSLNNYRQNNIKSNYQHNINNFTNTLRYDKVDVITSDMCPNRMGGTADRFRIAHLQLQALNFSIPLLRQQGHFVCKVLGSKFTFEELYNLANKHFMNVHLCKPPASRIHSDESFMVAYSKLAEPRSSMYHIRNDGSKYGLDDWPGSCRRNGNLPLNTRSSYDKKNNK